MSGQKFLIFSIRVLKIGSPFRPLPFFFKPSIQYFIPDLFSLRRRTRYDRQEEVKLTESEGLQCILLFTIDFTFNRVCLQHFSELRFAMDPIPHHLTPHLFAHLVLFGTKKTWNETTDGAWHVPVLSIPVFSRKHGDAPVLFPRGAGKSTGAR